MSPQWSRLLIAVEAEELFRRFEAYIATDLRAGPNLRARHCLPEQTDLKLREYDTDAVIVIQPRFQDDLPAAVRRWKSLRPDLQVLFCFRRLPKTRSLVELMRSGAFDVLDTEIEAIREPVIQDILNNLVRRLDEVRISSYEREQTRNSLAGVGLIGESMEMQNLFMQVLHAARLSGKQIVTLDCQSLSPALLRAALFGPAALAANANSAHAVSNPGRGPMLAAAEHGTLLLNEIASMPGSVQGQLQKLLETGESDAHAASDVRFVSTSSKRMDQLVETKSFRADLCYRLNVLPIEIPPLRRHLPDVPLLARYFLSGFERDGRGLLLSEEAAVALSRYHWPSNVRELKEALEFAVTRSVGDAILPSHLPQTVTGGGHADAEDEPFASSELNLARLERQAILRALQTSGFDKAKAARLLGIGKTTMYRKLKEMRGKARL